MSDDYCSGFVCFVGRPNTGKSTLMNALVGEKIAITSERPETTRHTIRGIITRPTGQMIIVDTPGIHRPRTLLGERLNELVKDTYSGVDIIGFCLPANAPLGKGDEWILRQVRTLAPETPIVGILTKIDTVSRDTVVDRLIELSDFLGEDVPLIPVSARSSENLDTAQEALFDLLPSGPQFYPDEDITDDETEKFLSELIREALLEDLHDELPHSVACAIEEMYEDPDDPDRTVVVASIYVERDSQKGIIIGKKGARIREVGRRARQGMSKVLNTKVFLDLHVKVLKNWQSDPKQLGKLGF